MDIFTHGLEGSHHTPFLLQMTNRKVVALLALATALPFAGCADSKTPSPILPAGEASLDHACDGSIPKVGQYQVVVQGETNTVPEVEGQLDTGCGYMLLTGVAGAVEYDSNYRTLWLTGRNLYHDGTWSAPVTRVYGNSALSPEASLSIPEGYAIVGIAMGHSGNATLLTTIELKYRQVQLVNGQLSLTGPVFTTKVGSDSFADDAKHQLPTTNDREVYVGLGARASVEKTKVLRIHTGALY